MHFKAWKLDLGAAIVPADKGWAGERYNWTTDRSDVSLLLSEADLRAYVIGLANGLVDKIVAQKQEANRENGTV